MSMLPRALRPTLEELGIACAEFDRTPTVDGLLTDHQKWAFLELVAMGHTQHGAASVVCGSYMTVARTRSARPEFNEQLKHALEVREEARRERLEDLLYDRVVNGTVEDVYHNGLVVGEKVNHGPHTLLQFALKALDPDKYKDRSESTMNVNASAPPPQIRNDEDAKRLLAKMQTELKGFIEGEFEVVKPETDGSDLL